MQKERNTGRTNDNKERHWKRIITTRFQSDNYGAKPQEWTEEMNFRLSNESKLNQNLKSLATEATCYNCKEETDRKSMPSKNEIETAN